MRKTVEILFSPAEFAALAQRDLADTVCVVFDVLRATSTMLTALAHGAKEIIPVAEIAEALDVRAKQPGVLLAGERNGLRICASQSGGIDFDLGNSPREYVETIVSGRTIVLTTTNGTRALRACAAAKEIMIGAFLNMQAVARRIRDLAPEQLLIVCSGTFDQIALEDVLAAGALCELIWPLYADGHASDSVEIARRLYQTCRDNLDQAIKMSRNGRRLLAHPDLRDDVQACLNHNTIDFVACMNPDGSVRRA